MLATQWYRVQDVAKKDRNELKLTNFVVPLDIDVYNIYTQFDRM